MALNPMKNVFHEHESIPVRKLVDLFHVFHDPKKQLYGLYHPTSVRLFRIDFETHKKLKEIERAYLRNENLTRVASRLEMDKKNLASELEELMQLFQKAKPEKKEPMMGGESLLTLKKIAVHVSNKCNLACPYCYAAFGNYQGKEGLMNTETMESVLHFLDEWGRKYNRKFVIQFFGGEPLLNWKIIKKFTEMVRDLNIKSIHRYSIVTNGTVYNSEIHDLLNENRIITVVSFDGDKTITNFTRINKQGKGMFKRIQEVISLLNQDRKFSLGSQATITPFHLDLGIEISNVLDIGYDLGIDGMHVAPAGPPVYWSPEKWTQFIESYARALEHSFDLFRKSNGRFYFSILLRGVRGLLFHEKKNLLCSAGTQYFSISTDGFVYPCFAFTNNDLFKITHVTDENAVPVVESESLKNLELLDRLKNEKTGCAQCYANSLCDACIYSNYERNDDLLRPDRLGCKMERYLQDQLFVKVLWEKYHEPTKWKEFMQAFTRKKDSQHGLEIIE